MTLLDHGISCRMRMAAGCTVKDLNWSGRANEFNARLSNCVFSRGGEQCASCASLLIGPLAKIALQLNRPWCCSGNYTAVRIWMAAQAPRASVSTSLPFSASFCLCHGSRWYA